MTDSEQIVSDIEQYCDEQGLELAPWQKRYLRHSYGLDDDEDVDLGDLTLPRYDAAELLLVGAGTLVLVALTGVCGYIGYGLVQLLRVVR